MQLKVLYFGSIREAIGVSHETLTLPDGSVSGDVRALLADRIPGLKALLERSATAVNHSYVQASHPLADGDEVAILPPVSGGAVFVV